MKKALVALIALIVIGGAAAFVALRGADTNNQASNESADTSSNSSTTENTTQTDEAAADAAQLRGANLGETVDATDKTDVAVTIEDFKFDITTLTIKKGTTVTWTNQGDAGHTVTSANSSPQKFTSSGTLAHGDTYKFTFADTGTYYYFCAPHASQMRAIIKVVD